METLNFTEWKPDYSVGNWVLDSQHKQLLRLCRQSISCMDDESREGISKFHIILNELSEYVDIHFQSEEVILKGCNYALLAGHKEEHLAYQEQLATFLKAATTGEINKQGLAHYLSQWWSEHILSSDKQYMNAIQRVS